MAVLDSLIAAIRIDGKALLEYDDHGTAPIKHLVSKYVEAPTGKEFSIHVIVPKHYEMTSDRLGVRVSIIGKISRSL